MGSNIDLRKFQNSDAIQDAYSLLVSGKKGYKAVIEKKKIPPKCEKCGRGGDIEQKFCPQCGGKMIIPLTNCPDCQIEMIEQEKVDLQFCTNCGKKLKD